jgi:hypothetical protein
VNEYKSVDQLVSVALSEVNKELRQLFSGCRTMGQVFNTASAIYKAVKKENKALKEQNSHNDNARRRAQEEIIEVRRN